MNHGYLDRYARQDSVIHRLPAGAKCATAALLVVATAFIGISYAWLLVTEAAILVFLIGLSHIPVAFFLKRLLLFEPLVLGAAIVTLLSPHGWLRFVILLARSNLAVATMILLANTTPFSDILRILRALRVPPLFLTVLSLMYRYLYLIIDQAERMSRARKSRAFIRRGGRSWPLRSGLVAMLFLRSTERAERIHAAMMARGWR